MKWLSVCRFIKHYVSSHDRKGDLSTERVRVKPELRKLIKIEAVKSDIARVS